MYIFKVLKQHLPTLPPLEVMHDFTAFQGAYGYIINYASDSDIRAFYKDISGLISNEHIFILYCESKFYADMIDQQLYKNHMRTMKTFGVPFLPSFNTFLKITAPSPKQKFAIKDFMTSYSKTNLALQLAPIYELIHKNEIKEAKQLFQEICTDADNFTNYLTSYYCDEQNENILNFYYLLWELNHLLNGSSYINLNKKHTFGEKIHAIKRHRSNDPGILIKIIKNEDVGLPDYKRFVMTILTAICPDDLNVRDEEGKTPLIYALEKNLPLTSIQLLITKENINQADAAGKLPLDYAINPMQKALITSFSGQQAALNNNNNDITGFSMFGLITSTPAQMMEIDLTKAQKATSFGQK